MLWPPPIKVILPSGNRIMVRGAGRLGRGGGNRVEAEANVAVISLPVVNRNVAGPAQLVKERALRCPNDVPFEEPINEPQLPFLRAEEHADLRGRSLREHLAELAELEQRDRGIAGEMLLGLRRERDEPRVMMREVGEVRGGFDVHGYRRSR